MQPEICHVHDRELEPLSGIDPNAPDDARQVCFECHREELVQRQAQVDDAARAVAHAKHEQKQRERALEQRLGAACIPARYRSLTFASYPGAHPQAQRVCSTLRSYANTFPQSRKDGISVLLLGGTGVGKTGLALAVGNAVIADHGLTAVYMTAYGAVRHQRDTWGRKGRTEREALDDLLQPDLLILDEIGSSVGTESEMAMLFEVLDGRYGDAKPTILVSNLPMDDYEVAGARRPGLMTVLGPRIIDRFRDDGSFTLQMSFPSLRGTRTS